MSIRRRIEALCLPVLVVSTVLSVVLGLVLIWSGRPPELLGKVLASVLTLALGSGWLIGSTRRPGPEDPRDP